MEDFKLRIYKNQGNPAVLNQINGSRLHILDVGCGAGDNAIILNDHHHIIDGITHSKAEADLCCDVMRDVYCFDLNNGLPENITGPYDYVICSHVLEHIAYPEKMLADIHSILGEKGRLIVALPNIMHYSSRWKLLLGKFNYEESGIWDKTHLRWYTFQSGRKMLEQNGFYIERQWVEGELPALRFFKLLPGLWRIRIFKLLSSISKGLFAVQLLYIARRRS